MRSKFLCILWVILPLRFTIAMDIFKSGEEFEGEKSSLTVESVMKDFSVQLKLYANDHSHSKGAWLIAVGAIFGAAIKLATQASAQNKADDSLQDGTLLKTTSELLRDPGCCNALMATICYMYLDLVGESQGYEQIYSNELASIKQNDNNWSRAYEKIIGFMPKDFKKKYVRQQKKLLYSDMDKEISNCLSGDFSYNMLAIFNNLCFNLNPVLHKAFSGIGDCNIGNLNLNFDKEEDEVKTLLYPLREVLMMNDAS